ncbi:MAG: hypothetical protein HZA62_09890 [Rhodocyclales bacterium]|nr:hypothetical protein [Rhodocyclales bacterium]
MSATAEEMGGQAAQLQERMAFFRVEAQGGSRVGAGGTAKRAGSTASNGPAVAGRFERYQTQ